MTKDQHEVIINNQTYAGVDIRVYAVVRPKKTEYRMGSDLQPAPFQFDMSDGNIIETQTYQKPDVISDPMFVELGEIQTLSYSIYRDKEGVRALGKVMPKGFTRGGGTLAGTMIFTVFHSKVLNELSQHSLVDTLSPDEKFENLRIDQLPPLDIFVTFQNEAGGRSRLGIYGVEFINEGQVMSVQDLITENSVNYVARHISPLRRVDSNVPTQHDFSVHEAIMGIPMTDKEYSKAVEELQAMKKRWL